MEVPKRIIVEQVHSRRYKDGERPSRWEERLPGFDEIITTEGSRLTLASTGGQSPPEVGWEILLTRVNSDGSYQWTLFGLKRAA